MAINSSDSCFKVAIAQKRLEQRLSPLDEQALEHEASDVLHHSFMVNEMGRMLLFNALRYGEIDLNEFKRRALGNNPSGQNISRF